MYNNCSTTLFSFTLGWAMKRKKTPLWAICLETYQTVFYLCSDDYLYNEKCFINLNLDEVQKQNNNILIAFR